MGKPGGDRSGSAKTIAAAVVLMSGSVALFMTVPVRAPVRGTEATSFEERSPSTLADERWNELYRRVLTTPQSMIGGFEATDAALDAFVGRARRVPPEVSEAWKTVLRLKPEAWDVQRCIDYQRAGFT
ncbi:MAG: hypothetical protein WCF10_05480, partial [Polyangiales bacterium]